MVRIGALTTGVLATVDEHGTVVRGRLRLRWRVRSGDRWIDPQTDPTVRHVRPRAAPLAQTTVRVAGGDVIARSYALGEREGLVVVEVENDSPEAVAVAFAREGGGRGRLDDVLAMPRRPGAVEPDGAVVFPVPHRTVLRVAIGDPKVDVRRLPGWRAAARGWDQVLDRGMRVELPEPVQSQVDAARADALLAPPGRAAFADLEDWGFGTEAAAMWARLGFRARRAARRQRAGGRVPTSFLARVHGELLRSRGDDIELLPGFRPEWLGRPVAVHGAPVHGGALSFAIRWHGAAPALLWEAPPGTTLRAPALDPGWTGTAACGDALLAPPPARLLRVGSVARQGVRVEPPSSFA
jgi:hypothetical protein